MLELKKALVKEPAGSEAIAIDKPLEIILESFVAYYINLKVKAQEV